VVAPGAAVEALDATTGDLLWEYKRKLANPRQAASARTKTIAICQDIVVYTAPDSYVVGLDARTGEQRWQTKADDRGHTSGRVDRRWQGGDRRYMHGRPVGQLLHFGLRRRDRKRSLAVLHHARRRRSKSGYLEEHRWRSGQFNLPTPKEPSRVRRWDDLESELGRLSL
jgi:PQQ-like domain